MTPFLSIGDAHAGMPVTWNIEFFGSHVLHIRTQATLQVDPATNAFRFWIHTEAERDGQKQPPVDRYPEVTGNLPETTSPSAEDPALLITCSVKNWSVEGRKVSCNMSFRLQYTKFGGLGPSDIFVDEFFSGEIPAGPGPE